MAKSKEILETLTKSKLVEISHHLGFRSWQVISKGEIVKRLRGVCGLALKLRCDWEGPLGKITEWSRSPTGLVKSDRPG